MPLIPSTPKSFVEPNATDGFIWWLFRHQCVNCYKPGTEINELIPRSRSKKSILTWENRVVMCRECHGEYHRKGVSKQAIEELQQKRYNFLVQMGRKEYADYKKEEIEDTN